MKYSSINYAQAFFEAIETHPDKKTQFTENLARLIAKNGDLELIPKIINELKNLLTRKQGGHRVKIESARPLPEILLKKITSKFDNLDLVETYINPELIAGIRITLDNEHELDNSFSQKLKKLFKSTN